MPSGQSEIKFPRTDIIHLNAATEFIAKAQAKEVTVRTAEDQHRQRWLRSIYNGLCEAGVLNSQADSRLIEFPQGYQLLQVKRQKLQARSGAHEWDCQLVGSPYVRSRFRSPAEFKPHAIWFFSNAELDHSACTHRNGKKLQATEPLSLPSDSLSSTSVAADHPLHQDITIHSEFRVGELVSVALNHPIVETIHFNFEENDDAFSQELTFTAAAVPHIQALFDAYKQATSHKVSGQYPFAFQPPTSSNIGSECMQIGDLVRLKTARKDLDNLQQFVCPPSGPGPYFSRVLTHSPNIGGAPSRSIFSKIMAWQHPQDLGSRNILAVGAIGILSEVADKDGTFMEGNQEQLEKIPEAHHGDTAAQITSTFYNINRELGGSVTPSIYHLQTLVGLWPDDSGDYEDQKIHERLEASTTHEEQLINGLDILSEIAQQRENRFERCCPSVFVKMNESE
ncbi:hypothetical protein J3R30DRAFT_3696129 [Lentinula aciculospora]|uniref:Cryptic loci regulator 2 N-terminal domain-containing protein n=1 Tax=Lentinula aciculospora TaxID=153920 RepID=A0A9W9DVC8_9AGAR|nr:hypothetical protein J3R30DRAFT_3696129 [Lentinula aciculospora]